MAQQKTAMMKVKKEKQAKKEKRVVNEFFGVKLSPPEWLIEETTFGLDPQHIQESLFTMGNGFIGSRGILEENPDGAMPQTYITGVYDKSGAQVEELVNLPNPINFIVTADGEKIDMHLMGFKRHERYLDMQKGLLARRTIFQDGRKRRYLYESLRFFSMHDPYIGWMKISITLLNGKAKLTAVDIHDDSVFNYGGLVYGRRRHVHLKEVQTTNNINYYSYRTHTTKIWISYADRLSVERDAKESVLHDRVYDFEMKAKESITFTKTFSINTSLQCRARRLKEETERHLCEAVTKGFDKSIEDHTESWKARWERANIVIKGDDLCDKAVRFNIYHLIIAAYKGNFTMSIGARALTGMGYRGHIFWDSEIFMLPFYLFTDPDTAKNMLLYRYNRLGHAIANAKKKGYSGALFPWESGGVGDEATPRYAKDVDGSVMEVDTIDYEHHISGDIAYAVFNYFRATDDIDFMIRSGAEIVFSTARFWASRVTFNEKIKKFEILDIIGPDEFHIRVKNNAYTNILASWNLEYAATLYYELKKKNPVAFLKLKHHLKLNDKETADWKDISKNIYVSRSKDGIIEQFEGYFKKKSIPAKSHSDFFMPEAPQHLTYKNFHKTQFIKQADTLLLFYLFPERFSHEEMVKNYQYYIKRTLHQSSLSHSTHAILASEYKDCLRAYALFLFAAQVDLKNLHNNTDGGMHMANVGGVWQAIVLGFAGISFTDGLIDINPRLPGHWHSVLFELMWKKDSIRLNISNRGVEACYYPVDSHSQPLHITVFKQRCVLEPAKIVKVTPKRKESAMVPLKRLKDIMKQENFVFVDLNNPVKDVTRLLREKSASSVPVVTGDKELCGIISKQDVINATEREDLSQLKAKDVMNKSVEYVKDSDHAEIALRLFTERSFQVLPVVKGKKLVGCITRKEILSACAGEYY